MAIIHDDITGLYMDIRRLVTGRGATPEDARAVADRAEAALKAQVKSAPPAKRAKYTVLDGVLRMADK